MSLQDSPQYKELKEAMELIQQLKIPEHLQQKALDHLLGRSSASIDLDVPKPTKKEVGAVGDVQHLRDFIAERNAKTAVQIIPCLFYWARKFGSKSELSETEVRDLFHQAGRRPTDNLSQSLRDLCSKRYRRLELVKGKQGYFRLSAPGESYVLYDLGAKT